VRKHRAGATAGVATAALLAAGAPAAAAPAPVLAVPPLVPDTGSLLVRCGALVDGVRDTVRGPTDVLVRAGRIAAAGRYLAVPPGVPVLDLPGHTCLPGLIDLHVHIAERPEDTADLSVNFRRSRAESAVVARGNAHATLLAGFTTVRSVGNYLAWTDRDLRDEISAGRTAGPRVAAAGYYLTIPGGGGDLVIPGHAERDIPPEVRRGVARGPAGFRARAQAAVDGGADLLKVIASGAVLAYGGVPGAPEMTPDELAAVVAVGRAAGLKVTAHAHGARSIREAILAGVDSIEHASLIDEAGIALARERGVVLVMDVYNGDWIDTEGRRAGWPAEFLRNNLDTTEAQRRGFTRAHAAGVTIGYGTDAGVYPHGLNARQFRIMVERGMTPMEAIRAATSVAARALGREADVGALEPGRYGDLVAVPGDPLADVRLLERVDVVVKGGLVFRLPAAPGPAA
jgi:imidazolonepropionase-like amidohydrolase